MKKYKGYPAPEFDGTVLRVLAHKTTEETDPILMLDYFETKEQNLPPGEWHPHRGIETFTYIKRGKMKEHDTLNGLLEIEAGGVLHLSAGSGIFHTGLPTKSEAGIQGFQIWFNMPSEDKMNMPFTEAFQDDVFPILKYPNYEVKLLVGKLEGIKAPLQKPKLDLRLLDVKVKGRYYIKKDEYSNFLFIYEGEGIINGAPIEEKSAYILEEDTVIQGTAKFLHFYGKPLNEPIAWRGPIVMNTQAEVVKAFEELSNETFIKERKEDN